MIRKRVKFQELLFTVTDVFTVFISYVVAVYIRYEIMESQPGLNTLSVPYLMIALVYSIVIANVLRFTRKTDGTATGIRVEHTFFSINAIGCLFLLAFFYMVGEMYFSRWALVLFWLFSSVFLLCKNILLVIAFNREQSRLTRQIRLVIVGDGDVCNNYIRAVNFDDACDFQIIGYVGEKSHIFFDYPFECDKEERRNDFDGWLGGYGELEAVLQNTKPGEVVFALEDSELFRFQGLFEIVKKMRIKACMVPSFGKAVPSNAVVKKIDEMGVIDLNARETDKLTGIYGLGLELSVEFLLLLMIIKRFLIGNVGIIEIYETYRCFIFAVSSYFLFFSMKDFMKEKKYRNTVCAVLTAFLSAVVIGVYELIYTQGKELTQNIISDFKMAMAVVLICWGVMVIADYIRKDDWPFTM